MPPLTGARSSVRAPAIERAVRHAARGLGLLATAVAPPVLRIALAVPFFRSGLTKWGGVFALSPSAIYLFTDEFKLHILGGLYDFPLPGLFALVDGVAEIALPILLVLGLATRFAALALLVMTGAIQLVVPEGWANFHLPWAGLALGVIALGPGPLSLDHLIDSALRRRRNAAD